MTEQSDKPSVDGLLARIRKCESMIGCMCAEGQPPLMSIPVDAERDEDVFICDTFTMIRERLAALAGPLEQPQEPKSDQANLAQASGVCDLQTALPKEAFARECVEIANAIKREYGKKVKYHGTTYYDFTEHVFLGRAGALLMRAAREARVEPVVGLNTEGRPTDKPAASSESSVSVILREVVSDLRHSANVDGHSESAASFLRACAERLDRASVSVPKERQ